MTLGALVVHKVVLAVDVRVETGRGRQAVSNCISTVERIVCSS